MNVWNLRGNALQRRFEQIRQAQDLLAVILQRQPPPVAAEDFGDAGYRPQNGDQFLWRLDNNAGTTGCDHRQEARILENVTETSAAGLDQNRFAVQFLPRPGQWMRINACQEMGGLAETAGQVASQRQDERKRFARGL